MASKILTELAGIVGMQSAIILTRKWGGRAMSVPRADKMHDLHPIALGIGIGPAMSLAREYGGTALQLPTEVNALIDLRNAEIVRRFVGDGTTGDSIRSLSLEFGVDRKMIQKIVDASGHRDLRLSRSMTD